MTKTSHSLADCHTCLLTDSATVCTSCGAQPRTVAGFRGTVRYASVNAHKNKVGLISTAAQALLLLL